MANKNVIDLTITTTTSGAWIEFTIPDGAGGYLSRRISYAVLAAAINDTNSPNKGWFENETALVAAYPSGEAGWFAINGDTSTVWIWNTTTLAWTNTGTTGVVTSVNGLTGVVVLDATDIDFASAVGLTATKVNTGIDEVKQYVDTSISGAGGVFIKDLVSDNDASADGTSGQTITLPGGYTFSGTDYTVIVWDNNGLGITVDESSKTTTTFDITSNVPGNFSYLAIYNTGSSTPFDADLVDFDNTGTGLTSETMQDVIEEIDTGYPLSFDSGDLTAGVLSITHNLGRKYISAIKIYDDNDDEVLSSNYTYRALTIDTGQITFYQPITNTWNLILKR